jgi:hypothetical protein
VDLGEASRQTIDDRRTRVAADDTCATQRPGSRPQIVLGEDGGERQ